MSLSRLEAPLSAVDSVAGVDLNILAVTTLDGDTLQVDFDNDGPTGLLVMTGDDCLSCVNLVYESWELYRQLQEVGGKILLIVRSDSASLVREYARTHTLPTDLVLDRSGMTVSLLGSSVHPLLVLVDSQGSVEAGYRRTSSDARRYPLPMILSRARENKLLPAPD